MTMAGIMLLVFMAVGLWFLGEIFYDNSVQIYPHSRATANWQTLLGLAMHCQAGIMVFGIAKGVGP